MLNFQVLIAIDKFVTAANVNQLEFLYTNGIIPLLYSLIERQINICRFALKIIVYFEHLPGVLESLVNEIEYIERLIKCFLQVRKI